MARTEFEGWRERIRQARTQREPHEQKWRLLWKLAQGPNYRGSAMPDKADAGQPLNLINNYIKTNLPHMLPQGRELEVRVAPKKFGPEYEQGAALLSDRLTAIAAEVRFLRQARRAVRASYTSVGILKFGLTARTGIRREVPSSKSPGDKVVVDVDAERVEYQEFHDAELPWARFVRPTRLLIDPYATDLDEATWVGHEVYRTVEGLKLDPNFKEAAAAGYIESNCSAPANVLRNEADDGRSQEEDPWRALIKLIEVHDRAKNEVIYVPDGRNSGPGGACVWAKLPWAEGVEGFPFTILGYEDVEEYFYPNPPLSPMLDLASTTDGIYDHVAKEAKKAKVLVIYDSTVITDRAIVQRIADAEDGEIVGVPGWKEASGQVVTIGGIHPDQFKVVSESKSLFDELSGVGNTRRGVLSEGSRTASEVQAVVQAQGILVDDMKGTVHEFIADGIGKMAGLYLAHQKAWSDLVLPLDRGGRMVQVGMAEPIVGERLDYSYTLEADSLERVDPAIRQKRTQDQISLSIEPNYAQKLAQEGYGFRTAPLIQRLLRDMGERDPGSFFVPLQQAPNPADKARAEDLEMVRTGEPSPVLPTDDHAAEMEIHARTYESLQLPAIALHLLEHERAMMQAMQPSAAPPMGEVAGPSPTPPGSLGPQGPMGGQPQQMGALQGELT